MKDPWINARKRYAEQDYGFTHDIDVNAVEDVGMLLGDGDLLRTLVNEFVRWPWVVAGNNPRVFCRLCWETKPNHRETCSFGRIVAKLPDHLREEQENGGGSVRS